MKRIYRELSGHTARMFGAEAAGEQEILLTLANGAIQIFALESALLRAEKACDTVTGNKQELHRAIIGIVRSKQNSNLSMPPRNQQSFWESIRCLSRSKP